MARLLDRGTSTPRAAGLLLRASGRGRGRSLRWNGEAWDGRSNQPAGRDPGHRIGG